MSGGALGIRALESRVGQEVGVSPWVEITQERIDTFAKAIDEFLIRVSLTPAVVL